MFNFHKFKLENFVSFLEKLYDKYLLLFSNEVNRDLEKMYLHDVCKYWILTHKYNAQNKTTEDIQKLQYSILRENHVIEKGMSILNPRKGWGQEKVMALIERLTLYRELYSSQDKEFLIYPLSTINKYIVYTKEHDVEIPEIEKRFQKLRQAEPTIQIENVPAGIEYMTRKQLQDVCNRDFKSLLYSRHSIRYFSDQEVCRELIMEALNLAQRTPSACNRQGWHTHIFRGEESVRLMYWQEGCRGCEENFRQSILVTADLKAFLAHEVFQAYIDGGLYAMNLINALHSLGLGTIPLSCGFGYDKLQYLDQFNIPENEIPILIIAFGHVTGRFHFAASKRKNINKTNVFHYS